MKHRKYMIAFTVAAVLAVTLGITTAYFYTKTVEYENYLEMANRRGFAQLMSSMSSIDSNLQKIKYSQAGPTLSSITASIWKDSEVAKYALATLPLQDANLEKYEKFIAQTGDYSFSLLRASAGGAAVTEENLQALESLAGVASTLSDQLFTLQERLDANDSYIQINPNKLSMSGGAAAAQGVTGELGTAEEEFPEYASLIYDGPFSEHINSSTPKMLEGLTEVTEEQAKKAANTFLSGGQTLTADYQGQGLIPYYSFSFDEASTIQVSKVGGVVLYMTSNRDFGEKTLSAEEAIAKAKAFLETVGYTDMTTSYYTVFETIITINFAYTIGDVTVYPDLVKVGVALDNGDVVRFDAAGYVMNHTERQIQEPAVSRDDAWADIPAGLEVISENTALIPTSGKNEVLCHEFVCKNSNGQNVIVYVNAQTGLQENILLLIESENGMLTV